MKQLRRRIQQCAHQFVTLQKRATRGVFCALVLLIAAPSARADVTLLLELPINALGHFSATGHAALLTDDLCSDNHVHMRPCRSGETGSVISRYHLPHHGYDWIAISPEAYLFASAASGSTSPVTVGLDRSEFQAMQASYRAQHAAEFLAPLPDDIWVQLVGASYRREIVAVRLRTTDGQQDRLMAWLNARKNRSHFNFFFNNCADFVRQMLNVLYPGAVRRSLLFDAGMTTPEQLADSMRRYARRRPNVGFDVRVLPQVPGELPRSAHMYGVTESFVKRTPWALPLVILDPVEFGGVIASGLLDPRWDINRAAKAAPPWHPLASGDDEASTLASGSHPAEDTD